MIRSTKLRLRARFSIAIVFITLFIAISLSSALIHLTQRDFSTLSHLYDARIREDALQSSQVALSLTAEQLANALVDAVYFDDFDHIKMMIQATKVNPELTQVQVLTPDGLVLHDGRNKLQVLGTSSELPLELLADASTFGAMHWHTPSDVYAVAPIQLHDDTIGYTYLSSSLSSRMAHYQQAADTIDQEREKQALFHLVIALTISGGFAILAVIAADQLSRYLSRPILKIRDHAIALGRGEMPEGSRVEREDEIGDLADAIYRMADDLEVQARSARFLAFHDPLTSLANRVNLQSKLESAIETARDSNTESGEESVVLFFLDLDDFKDINDSEGHQAGDRALRVIAERLNQAVDQELNTHPTEEHLIARIGGDEFTIMMRGEFEHADLASIAENVLARVAEMIPQGDKLFHVSGSIGIALYPNNASNASDLLKCADLAMYNSKHLGKGTYRFYDGSMEPDTHSEQLVKAEFKQALSESDQLRLLFQPISDLRQGCIVGAEALIRWDHPRLGFLSPTQFISIIEHNQIALPTDLWVLERTADLLDQTALLDNNFVISVNISASNLTRPQFLAGVEALFANRQHLWGKIRLEITETFLTKDEPQVKATLTALRKIGFKIWLDDFGTGYSSLNHLKFFPVDGIKIDRQFITGIADFESDYKTVSAILGLAESFNVDVVAEGVSSIAIAEKVRQLGCRYGQGELICNPLETEELLEFIHGYHS